MPVWGIGYNKGLFQNCGSASGSSTTDPSACGPTSASCYEGQEPAGINQLEQYGQGPPGYITKVNGPFDVLPSFWQPSVLNPKEWEPRLSVAYQLTPNDAVRFAYGRSAVFGNAQSTGTPFNAYNVAPFMKIPPDPGLPVRHPVGPAPLPVPIAGEQLYRRDRRRPGRGPGRRQRPARPSTPTTTSATRTSSRTAWASA